MPPLPDELPRVLSRVDARLRGFTPRMIDRRLAIGTWRLVLPHTYLTSDTFTWLDRRRAALAFVGDGSVLSGAAALTDASLRSIQRPSIVLVLAPITTRARSIAWVRVRPTRRLPPAALRPGPASAPRARAVADHALQTARLDDVRALVAEVVRRRLCTIDDLLVELDAGPRNGSRNLRLAIEEVRGGAWSAPEARAARLLTAAGVPLFEQNVRIDLPDGSHLIVDFLWRALRAVLEIDSDEHHGLPADADATDTRHVLLESLGYSVVHRRPSFVMRQPSAFTAGIVAWLASRDQQPRHYRPRWSNGS